MATTGSTMKAAVYIGPGELRIEDRPIPEPGPGEVLVEVSHCGVCGSDIHCVLDGWGRPGAIEGHEWSGTVSALGQDVTDFAVGDAVVGGPSERCGECRYCREGRPSLCEGRGKVGVEDNGWQGAFATYIKSKATQLLRVPPGLSLRHAALTEPMAVALHGITRAGGFGAGDRWLITGGGPIGYLSVAALKANGIDDVVVSEPTPSRRALCEALGAQVVSPEELVDPPYPHEVVENAFDVALECSGRADAQMAALGQLRRGGMLVLVGAGLKAPKFSPNRILLNELTITGSFVYDEGGFDDAIALLASGRVPLDLLVEARDYPLDDLFDTMTGLAAGDIAAKALITPQEVTR